MEEEAIIVEDSENFRGNEEGYGYKIIVLKQVSRIASLGSRELRAGWWKKSLAAGGHVEVTNSYIPDSREDYSRAVEVLHDLLQPKFDSEMSKCSRILNNKIEELYNTEKDRDSYREKRLKVMRRMFQKLCLFLERMGWLESEILTE